MTLLQPTLSSTPHPPPLKTRHGPAKAQTLPCRVLQPGVADPKLGLRSKAFYFSVAFFVQCLPLEMV